MKIGPLYILERVQPNKRSWCIAALHWSWSLTWRWALHVHPYKGGRIGPYYQPGRNLFMGLNTPWFSIHLSSQDNVEHKQQQRG